MNVVTNVMFVYDDNNVAYELNENRITKDWVPQYSPARGKLPESLWKCYTPATAGRFRRNCGRIVMNWIRCIQACVWFRWSFTSTKFVWNDIFSVGIRRVMVNGCWLNRCSRNVQVWICGKGGLQSIDADVDRTASNVDFEKFCRSFYDLVWSIVWMR